MNWIVAALAIVAAFDVAQRSRQLRAAPAEQRLVVAGGAAVVAVVIAALATPMLDALDISGPNMQIGAGVVLAVYSLIALAFWDDTPAPAAIAGGTIPLLFPLVMTPAVGVVLLAVAARNGLLVPALASVAAAAIIASSAAGGIVGRRPLRMLTATIGVVTGVAMIVDGAFAV